MAAVRRTTPAARGRTTRAAAPDADRPRRPRGGGVKALSLDDTRRRSIRLLDEVEKVIVGKRDALELVLLGILSRGHVLLEDNPGLGKTLTARSFAQALGLEFRRVQFTPDLLPADITGSFVYDQGKARFEFRPGPLFTNLLLADEINRTPPKTQAALLEVMQENQVSIEGTTFPLEPPFIVLATQNPIEYEGTYPLPEAQLDRFLLRVSLGYPDRDDEWEVLRRRMERATDETTCDVVVTRPELLGMQAALEQVHVDETVGQYIVDLVAATRAHPLVLVGASPRGALALLKVCRARAVLDRRDYVTPDDVKLLAEPALAHRLTLSPDTWVRRITGRDIVAAVLADVATPPPVVARAAR